MLFFSKHEIETCQAENSLASSGLGLKLKNTKIIFRATYILCGQLKLGVRAVTHFILRYV